MPLGEPQGVCVCGGSWLCPLFFLLPITCVLCPSRQLSSRITQIHGVRSVPLFPYSLFPW